MNMKSTYADEQRKGNKVFHGEVERSLVSLFSAAMMRRHFDDHFATAAIAPVHLLSLPTHSKLFIDGSKITRNTI
jgi:hypothetical protein